MMKILLQTVLENLYRSALESSNVNVVQELVDMIETQRAYEVNSKAISGVDDMLDLSIKIYNKLII